MMGFTCPERIEIFNTRISQIQISWLAYCNTLGFETIDYIIADPNLISSKEEKLYENSVFVKKIQQVSKKCSSPGSGWIPDLDMHQS